MFAEQMLPRARERLTTISEAASVKDAAALMAKPHTDLVVVCGEDGGMVGVVTRPTSSRRLPGVSAAAAFPEWTRS
jgi:CBS domain-containing protein